MEIQPLTAMRVARRSLVLAAVVCRASIEQNAADPEAEALHVRVIEWLTRLNLWDEVEPDEQVLLRSPTGQLSPSLVIQASWLVEGLAVLAWALRLLDLPQFGEQVTHPHAVADAVWFLDDTAQDVVANAELRGPAELDAYRELLYAVHSRLRDFARNRQWEDFTHWIEKSWLDALGLDVSEVIVDDDLAVDGKAISEVAADRLQEFQSIIYEQHRAIIWLLEGPESYSQVTVDT